MRRGHENGGFTLIELMVVLGIILIITSVAIASFSALGTPKQQLRSEARGIFRLFSDARLAAMEHRLQIDVFVNPDIRSVCAVEAGYSRKWLAANEGLSPEEIHQPTGSDSNRFVRMTALPESFELEAFALSDIDTDEPDDDKAPLVETGQARAAQQQTNGVIHPAFHFTQLGGASGGGISVSRDGVRIDIACDVLTGRPELVHRKAIR